MTAASSSDFAIDTSAALVVGNARLWAASEGVDVVRPAAQQNDCRTVGRADVDVADVGEAGRDLLDGAERAAQLFSLCC
jgi:hypothetical protein